MSNSWLSPSKMCRSIQNTSFKVIFYYFKLDMAWSPIFFNGHDFRNVMVHDSCEILYLVPLDSSALYFSLSLQIFKNSSFLCAPLLCIYVLCPYFIRRYKHWSDETCWWSCLGKNTDWPQNWQDKLHWYRTLGSGWQCTVSCFKGMLRIRSFMDNFC